MNEGLSPLGRSREETFVGCEVEIYRTVEGFVMMDPNPGKVGGGKRMGAFPALHSKSIRQKAENLARSLAHDVNGDSYMLFDMQTGIQRIEGKQMITPFVLAVERVIEERGHKIKGLVGREKIFSFEKGNWKIVERNSQGEVAGVEYNEATLLDVASSDSVYLGCHFAPPDCRKNSWNEDTRKNGLINNMLDLPGISWLMMREIEGTPYGKAFIFSSRGKMRIKGPEIPIARDYKELRERVEGLSRVGFDTLALKDISKMSIGGRNVSFLPAEAMMNGEIDMYFFLHPSVLVMPFYETVDVEAGGRLCRLQTRILYSSEGGLKPELIIAKAYPPGADGRNMSSFCADSIVWDLKDEIWYLHTQERGVLEMKRGIPAEERSLSRYFEEAIESCFPKIMEIESTLSEAGGDYGRVSESYRKLRRQGLIPDNAHTYLNMFV